MPEAYNKIAELKTRREKLKSHFKIQVDGGVTNQNSKQLITAGADNLVAGSFIFKVEQKDYQKQVQSLGEN
jgi:ribulose-phosphate 3-epimerase